MPEILPLKMKPISYCIAICILFLICSSCKSTLTENDFSITTNSQNAVFTIDDTLQLSIINPKNSAINNVDYFFNSKKINPPVLLKEFPLGEQQIEAKLKLEENEILLTKKITLVNTIAPKVYTYKILNRYPHDITSYTQGLEFYNGYLYESTGQHGKSTLRKIEYQSGKIIQNINLANEYFGEGLTILNDSIYQLTWRSKIGFVYEAETLKKIGNFKYGKSKEGWGICNNGKQLYKSDGTEKIWILNPKTLTEEHFIQAYHNKGKVIELNELEWVNGKIYANRYQKNGVAIINPENGAIEAVIDFSNLKSQVKQHPNIDVLNGIAYNPSTKTLFVTGKHWDTLFEVEIIKN